MKNRILAALLLASLLLFCACGLPGFFPEGTSEAGSAEPADISADTTPAPAPDESSAPDETTFPDVSSEITDDTSAPEDNTSEDSTTPETLPDTSEIAETSDETEPVTEPDTEPVTEPLTEPITEPITEPVTTPVTTPAETTAPPAPKIRVGISCMTDNAGLANYVTSVKKAGCEAVILPFVGTVSEARAALDKVDALVMTGGEDLDPKYYNETKGPKTLDVNEKRDASDVLLLTEAISRNMPTLCICRGMQILNVVCGGTLYQDIPTQISGAGSHRDPKLQLFVYHTIKTEKGSVIRNILGETATVNSWHHQAIKDLGSNIAVTARGLDGVIEAIELTSKSYIVGVQFHPEKMAVSGYSAHLKFFTELASHVK